MFYAIWGIDMPQRENPVHCTAEDIARAQRRAEEIRNLIAEGDPDRARKNLLNLADDYRESIDIDTINDVTTKSGDFIEARRAMVGGWGEKSEFEKIKRNMLTLAQSIVQSLEQNSLAKPAAENSAETSATMQTSTTTQHDMVPPAPKHIATRAATILSVRGMSKNYSSTEFSLSNISFDLKVGEITAVVGRNGSGKSTLLNIVLGLVRPDKGEIVFPLHGDRRPAHGFVQQRPPAWRGQLRENLEFMASANGIKGASNRRRVNFLLNRFDLVGREYYQWKELSGGYQLRYELAKALAHRPQLLVLDEPLAHLDLLSQEQLLWDLKAMANSREPACILLTSQHLFEMEAIADQLVVLQEGETVFVGATEEVNPARQYNRFELGSSAGATKLKADVGSEAIFSTDANGILQVDTDKKMGADALLAKLDLQELRYFRDISTSTKSLMIDRIRRARTTADSGS